MNLSKVDLRNKEVQKTIKDAIEYAFEGYLERLDLERSGYDYGIDYEDVKKAENEAFQNIIDFITEL